MCRGNLRGEWLEMRKKKAERAPKKKNEEGVLVFWVTKVFFIFFVFLISHVWSP